jgi:predicted helicase
MAQIYHFDLYGRREDKYKFLLENDVYTVEWKEVSPQHPFYLFSPQNRALLPEYNEGWKIIDIMPVNSTGVKTHRDDFVFDFDISILRKGIEDFRNLSISDQQISNNYDISSTRDWNLSSRRRSLAANNKWQEYFTQCLYRPFDLRAYYHHEDVVELPRNEVMRHMLTEDNLGLVFMRQVALQDSYSYFLVTRYTVDNRAFYSNKGTMNLAPLYIYPDNENEQGNLLSDAYCGLCQRTPNLSQKFLSAIREKLGYLPTPEAIFYYAYVIFHRPTYRQRYAEFLKIDFPRLPLTTNNELFQALSEKGEELVELHLMKSKKLNKIITKYPVSGDNAVTEVTYKQPEQRIYINKQRYFEGIAPEIWMFKIGGYQVLDKWLKDRKKAKRSLSFDDVLHYQRVIVALKETMQIMTEIDQLIPSFPIE